MNTVAIIQARMGSTRLPGKVMLDLQGTSVLGWVIRRVRASPRLDEVVVATTDRAEDDVVANEAERRGARVYRGSSHNVLSRYGAAAREYGAAVVVRITADCPLYDPALLTAMLGHFHDSRGAIDYLASRHYPRGLDTEIFTRACLETTCEKASKPYEFEHVTPYVYHHPDEFRLASHSNDKDLSHCRWTLDTADDWRFVQAIYQALGDGERIFSTHEILALLEAKPELAAINAHVVQKKLGE